MSDDDTDGIDPLLRKFDPVANGPAPCPDGPEITPSDLERMRESNRDQDDRDLSFPGPPLGARLVLLSGTSAGEPVSVLEEAETSLGLDPDHTSGDSSDSNSNDDSSPTIRRRYQAKSDAFLRRELTTLAGCARCERLPLDLRAIFAVEARHILATLLARARNDLNVEAESGDGLPPVDFDDGAPL